jgi:hypothetical protein
MIGLRLFVNGALNGGTALIFLNLSLTFSALAIAVSSRQSLPPTPSSTDELDNLVTEGWIESASTSVTSASFLCDGVQKLLLECG